MNYMKECQYYISAFNHWNYKRHLITRKNGLYTHHKLDFGAKRGGKKDVEEGREGKEKGECEDIHVCIIYKQPRLVYMQCMYIYITHVPGRLM